MPTVGKPRLLMTMWLRRKDIDICRYRKVLTTIHAIPMAEKGKLQESIPVMVMIMVAVNLKLTRNGKIWGSNDVNCKYFAIFCNHNQASRSFKNQDIVTTTIIIHC